MPKPYIVIILWLFTLTFAGAAPTIVPASSQEDIPTYLKRNKPENIQQAFRQIIGAANDFKEGDVAIGVGAESSQSRENARQLILNTKALDYLQTTPILTDDMAEKIAGPIESSSRKNPIGFQKIQQMRIREIKQQLLTLPAEQIKKEIMPYLHSDIISALVKVMSNSELQHVGAKIFNPLPGSDIGKEGYLSARIQPNSPTDHPKDIFWQVMNAWSFGVGDLMLGNNPGSSTPETVERTELVLKDILHTFGHQDKMPWVVLSHIDIQNEIEAKNSGSTAMFFQSIAGTDKANQVFDTSSQKMMDYAFQIRKTMDKQSSAGNKRFFGVYLETGQGSEFTNEASENIDMLTLESRKQGLGRAMKEVLGNDAWLLLNDVSGFIGPEVFKTKDQLIRVALEDLVIAKLHGLTGGLDVCSTFHMPITPKELREALDEIVKARPAYLMALPTQNDPMLSYNTTPFQEHLRLRKENNLKIDSKMMNFFISIGVLNADGSPGLHFADPTWVFYKYLEAKDKGAGQLPRDRRFYNGDKLKSFEDVKKIAEAEMKEVTSRGVPLAIGHGATYLDFTPEMQTWLDDVDQRARKSIRKTWNSKWRNKFKSPILKTTSLSRDEYLSRPKSGESLSASAYKKLSKIDIKESDVVLVISDGLNADSLMDRGHLGPFLKNLKAGLEQEGLRVHKEPIVIQNGRVRVGYRVGEQLFGSTNGGPDRPKTVIHIIGERPGNGHNTFSAYISTSNEWAIPNSMNHDKTMLVSGIADTAFKPKQAATEVIQKVQERRQQILSMSKNSCLSFYNR